MMKGSPRLSPESATHSAIVAGRADTRSRPKSARCPPSRAAAAADATDAAVGGAAGAATHGGIAGAGAGATTGAIELQAVESSTSTATTEPAAGRGDGKRCVMGVSRAPFDPGGNRRTRGRAW